MMTLEEVRERLKDRKIRVVAKSIGVHPMTLYRLANNEQYDPKASMLEKLTEYFKANP